MNRRTFTKSLAFAATAIGLRSFATNAQNRSPQLAVTMDDFSWRANHVRLTGEERNREILKTLNAHSLQAALFVVGGNIDSEAGKRLLRKWNDAGHVIGNHTYSHRNYAASSMTTAAYEQDILKAETLLQEFPRFRKLFRFPMLKEGETVAKRDGLRSFLKEHGYRTGHVTIDNSDWIIDQRLTRRLTDSPGADIGRYRDFYLEHMWDRAQYYDALAKTTVGRSVKHTLLMHFNLLNALFLDDLLKMFKSKGWQLINAEDAFSDPVFAAQPKVLPAGESIVWSLAKESGKIDKNLRYPAEDGDYETARMDKLGL
jgi:peptidoglycan/xylan/chitin deacetylase (PgdA/CDA1 family)